MIEVNNQSGSAFDTSLLQALAEQMVRREAAGSSTVSVAFVKARTMRELNKKYRRKDYTANVLSFPAGNERTLGEAEGCLGEVVLCPSQIKKDAKKYGMIFEKALAWMLIHGILHLLGYDHVKERDARQMENKEDLYLTQL